MRSLSIASGVILCCATLTGCGLVPSPAFLQPTPPKGLRPLTGAGSTFDYPLLSRAFYDYYNEFHQEVNYQPIGSGGGILQLVKGTVQFGATDVPMNNRELALAARTGGAVLQIPITLGAEAIAYNLPMVHHRLRFSGPLLAAMFLGRVRFWDAPAIVALNPGVKLPHWPVLAVHRSDGSGTTYIFTNYLSRVSPAFSRIVGTGKAVLWPSGVGGKGNAAVAELVQNAPGAIGYVELAYVLQTHMPYGVVLNRAGRYVAPTLRTTTAAADAFAELTPSHFSIVDARGLSSYPICGYSWVVLYRHQPAVRGHELRRLLTWLVTTEQARASAVGNVPLPAVAQRLALQQLSRLDD